MKWFRSNIRHGARLALLALVIQFALSFGHSHGFAEAAPVPHSTLTPADGRDRGAVTIDREAASQRAPVDHDGDQHGDDHCAICAVMAMAHTVLFATPPLLLLPQAIEILDQTTEAEFAHLKSAGTAFRPRGPPVS